jgi:iron complex transport system permease protein
VTAAYGLASFGREVPTVSLLLAGVAVSSFVSAIVSLLMFMNREELITIVSWLMGSLSGRGWPALYATVPLILVGSLLLWLLSRSLDALTFGEESAASLGQHLGRLRILVVVAATLTTAAAVATSGIIGFVGLLAPHIARLFVGARHAYVIPASALVGATLLLVADNVARTVAAPAELPVGVITAIVGSPFFLYLLRRRQRGLAAEA